MDFKDTSKSGNSLENMYKSMCNEQGVKPKSLDELKEEARLEEIEAHRKKVEKANAKAKAKERKRFINKNTVRVVKKDKDGVTVIARGHTEKMSWSEFEKNFKPVEGEKYLYTFTEEFLKKAEEINELIQFTVIKLREVRVMDSKKPNIDAEKYLSAIAVFGELIEKLTTKLGCTRMEANSLVQKEYNNLFNPLTGLFANNLTI